MPKKKAACVKAKRIRRTKKQIEVDKFFESKVKLYREQKKGSDGRPFDEEKYRKAFYGRQFEVTK